ncbi:MAG: methionine--tRNA ligase [Armatimonadetes bacterium RBG_16_67_12]|nr:MAG: methionine--tRNA ligase [Armatimonadetes bacterium RBG_16_67_12]
MGKFYITTPIYYVNDVPHIGHAYTTIAADVAARFHRLAGDEVWFLTGTDEHGINILRAAERNNTSPREWTDRIAGEFRNLWDFLNISYDDFIRTTEPRHTKVVQEIFQRLHEKGDIYLGTYEGWYCPSCESFYPEGDLGPNRTCPIHTSRQVEWTAEESYLFRLSAYNEWLLKHIEVNPSAVEPEARRNEVLSLLRSGLKDIAVSRTTFTWGVPVSFDPKHVVYVWIDALTNYISAIGYLDDPAKFNRYWPADVHLMGKEIIRFHAVIWPIILHAAGIAVPKQTFAHGFLTFGGQKFSKSLGIILDPQALSREIASESGAELGVAVDALRYFLLREIPFGADGDFSKPALVGRFNADLANDFGNLLNRTLPLVARDFGGRLPAPGPDEGTDAALKHLAQSVAVAVFTHIGRLNFSQALSEIWRLLGAANKYIDEEAPWTAVKRGRADRAGTILYNTLEALRIATILLSPVLPTATQRVWEQLGQAPPLRTQRLDDARRWGGLPAGLQVRPGAPVFPRIDTRPKAGGTPTSVTSVPPVTAAAREEKPMDEITFDEFKRLDIRIAEVTAAERVAGTDKLVKLTVDIGDEVRTLVAGIATHYQAADLVGRRIVVLVNLQSRKLRGVESKGMLLAATWGDDVAILSVDGVPPTGARVS